MTQGCKLTFILLVVLAIVPYAFSIKCWNCRSSNDPKCADPFDNTTVPITDCKQEAHLHGLGPSMCRKIREIVNGELVVSRGCAWKRVDDDYSNSCPNSSTGPNEAKNFCETCDDIDGCNGASTIGKALALLLAPLALLLFK